MRRVLYTPDLEPITIIELSPNVERTLQARDCFVVTVRPKISLRDFAATDPKESFVSCQSVRIVAERLWYRNVESIMLITQDEEPALMLKSAFLPGQHKEVHAVRNKAFAEGFLTALGAL